MKLHLAAYAVFLCAANATAAPNRFSLRRRSEKKESGTAADSVAEAKPFADKHSPEAKEAAARRLIDAPVLDVDPVVEVPQAIAPAELIQVVQAPGGVSASIDNDLEATHRDLQQGCSNGASPDKKWHPTYSAGWANGYCRNTVDCNSPSYSTELSCCKGAYAGQTSGHCLNQLPAPPTGSPTTADMTAAFWYPMYEQDYAVSGCSNMRPLPYGNVNDRPNYPSQLTCCKAAYGSQMSGACLAMMPNAPTSAPNSSGGANFWYADWNTPFADATCINTLPVPPSRPTYSDKSVCCQGAYGGQFSNVCICSLDNPPDVCYTTVTTKGTSTTQLPNLLNPLPTDPRELDKYVDGLEAQLFADFQAILGSAVKLISVTITKIRGQAITTRFTRGLLLLPFPPGTPSDPVEFKFEAEQRCLASRIGIQACQVETTRVIVASSSATPTTSPTASPTSKPSMTPSISSSPSSLPSEAPSGIPSANPSETPSSIPSEDPSSMPSSIPSESPSSVPSENPSSQPSSIPSESPSSIPSENPSSQPSSIPSESPSSLPSSNPSSQPSSIPSELPSSLPSSNPSSMPSSIPSESPSDDPTKQPSKAPSDGPSESPSDKPSLSPSESPSLKPSTSPSAKPSLMPSESPSRKPSLSPSESPSLKPSATPSRKPSLSPSESPSLQPSATPSRKPSLSPSESPSLQPSAKPSLQPSAKPSLQPSDKPSLAPSESPSLKPSASPSLQPSLSPSESPSNNPTACAAVGVICDGNPNTGQFLACCAGLTCTGGSANRCA